MGISLNPQGINTLDTFVADKLIVKGPLRTESVTLAQDTNATDVSYVRGRLLSVNAAGEYAAIDPLNAGAVTISATNAVEVVSTSSEASDLEATFVLAHPPIPGTLKIQRVSSGASAVSSATSNTSCSDSFGDGLLLDNGVSGLTASRGMVDYEHGVVQYFPAGAPSATTDDIIATYDYLALNVTSTQAAVPAAILSEDVLGADIAAADQVVTVYTAGEFLASALSGYNAGYAKQLRGRDIIVRNW